LLSISSLFAYAEGMDVWLYGEGSPVGKEKQNIFIFMGYARMAKAWQNSHTNCLFPTHPVSQYHPPIPVPSQSAFASAFGRNSTQLPTLFALRWRQAKCSSSSSAPNWDNICTRLRIRPVARSRAERTRDL